MIDYNEGDILIRNMRESDAQAICEAERAQGWNADIEKYHTRLRDQSSGKSAALVAEYQGKVAGYVNVYYDCKWGSFGGRGWCEIVDFGVLEKFRRRGIGTALMDVAEQIAAGYADTVYLGVGLHAGYGSAQRMYVKRGYIPDGKGVWYGSQVCQPYKEYRNDDELNLYFSKKLK